MVRRGFLLAGALATALAASPSAQSPTLKSAMREKAAHASALLEPVVLADFGGVAIYAEQLSHISYSEISSWQGRPEPRYIEQATTFLRAVQGLRDAAAARSSEQAAAQYGALVTSCVQCHTYVRGTRPVSLTPPVTLPSVPPTARN